MLQPLLCTLIAAGANPPVGTDAQATATVNLGSQPVIAIDPGHGGTQLGARGVCGILEKDLALQVSQKVAALLNASQRVTTVMTRTADQDIPLEQRYEIANRAGAQLFVSIHANASTNPEARGIETFFLSTRAADRRIAALALAENLGASLPVSTADDNLTKILDGLLLDAAHAGSQRFAFSIQENLEMSISSVGRGVLQAPFVVLFGAQMPSALVEIGFVSHADECKILKEDAHQTKIAKAVAAAILSQLGDPSLASARP